jgi:hypothetical protein
LKLKTLLVLSLLAAVCCAPAFAKSKTYTFGLEDASGSGEYCNYLTWYTWGDNFSLAAGTDNLTSDCSAAENASLIGEKGSINAASGYPAVVGFAMGNNEVDVVDNANSGDAVQYVAGTKAGENWVVFVYDVNTDSFVSNYGTLTTSIPDLAKNHSKLKNAASTK